MIVIEVFSQGKPPWCRAAFLYVPFTAASLVRSRSRFAGREMDAAPGPPSVSAQGVSGPQRLPGRGTQRFYGSPHWRQWYRLGRYRLGPQRSGRQRRRRWHLGGGLHRNGRRSWHLRARLRLSRRLCRTMHLHALRFLLIESLRDVLEANIFITYALGHDAVFEGDAGGAAAEFAHLKAGGCLGADVESLAVPVRRQENVVFDAGIHSLPEDGFQVDASGSIDELGRARIFKPVLRRLDSVGFNPLRAPAAGSCNNGLEDAGAGSVAVASEGATSAGALGVYDVASTSASIIVGGDRVIY